MKCPNYIKEALFRRARHAGFFLDYDYKIAEFLKRNHIEVDSEDICGGAESYVNPFDSSKRIFNAIEAADDPRGRNE